MSRLRITTRITLWYAAFFVAFSLVVLFAAFEVQNIMESNSSKVKLTEVVNDTADEIRDSGKYFPLDKKIKYQDDGVYLSVYTMEGIIVVGRIPSRLEEIPAYEEESITTVRDENGDRWYVYDLPVQVGGTEYYIRGIEKGYAAWSVFSSGMVIFDLLFFCLLAIAILGGIWITRKAFRPVRDIIGTVQEIQEDGDVSRRIPMPESEDEIHSIASTINGMLDRIETVFRNEKQFTSDVSHELRTPIAVILAQSEYAQEDPDYQAQALETISREAHHMSENVNRLLLLSRSDAGRLPLQFESVDLSELCEMIAEQQKLLGEEEGMLVETSLSGHVTMEADEAMVIRIILNLMDNARKYAAPGKVELSLTSDEDYAYLAVTDDGPGIPDEYKDRIWERFFRMDDAHQEDGSSGLGLSIVKALVRGHGGEITLADNPKGTGCCFKVKLPRKQKGYVRP